MKIFSERLSKFMLIMFGAALLIFPVTANADDDIPVTFNQLPKKAQTFITKYFSEGDILLAKLDKDLMEKTYTVKFKNGSEIDFNGSGEWKEIECKNSMVPNGIIDSRIISKVKELYPDHYIKEVKKNKLNTEVKLSNGLELKFDKVINLIDVED